ncbi:MAG: hypothetical protein K2I56_08560 [Muribaculaceae bacterium]|nr:hypothetical protein [Muribaculaceae bacterium]
MSKLFLFGIGGTGARVIRSFTMMLAAGFQGIDSSVEIVPIILDHDKGNGDLDRAKKALDAYHSINKGLYPDAGNGTTVYKDSFFVPRVTPLSQVGVNNGPANINWHVQFGEVAAKSNMKYSDYIGLSTIAANPNLEATASLIECLYDDSQSNDPNAELNLELDKGFKGNPSIGTVVFNELKDDASFKSFLNNCNPGNGDRVFIVGSIFGGTGSSGIPVIVDEIRKSKIGIVNQTPIGVALVLPYFKLQPKQPDSTEDTGAIDCALFNAKTKAALGAYGIGGASSFNQKVTDLYYIGDVYTDAYEYHEGNNKQQNPAHVVEWVAATAIVDFLQNQDLFGTNKVKEYGVMSEGNTKAIDMPEISEKSRQMFVDDLSAFVFAMRYYLEVVCGTRNKIKDSTAFFNTFDLSNKLKSGDYDKVKQFVQNNLWGFYKWLEELEQHSHAFKPYCLEGKGKDLGNILSHKTVGGGFLSRNPATDDNVSGKINNLTKNTTDSSPRGFFKALHDASVEVIDKIIK